MRDRVSRCSSRSPIEFVWAGNPMFTDENEVDRAVKAFTYAIMSPPGRAWSGEALGITRREFRSLVMRGAAGWLIPVSEVKDIDRAASEFVFEIRYDFRAPVLDASGNVTSVKVKSRFYFSEPPLYPDHFVGLHVHEKVVVPGNHPQENVLQNAEIDLAIKWFDYNRPTNWGIT